MDTNIPKQGFVIVKSFFSKLLPALKKHAREQIIRYRKQRLLEKKKLLDKKLVASVGGKFFPRSKNIFYLPRVLSRLELRVLQVLVVLFLASSLYLLRSAFLGLTIEIPRLGGEFREGLVGRPRFLNPLYAQGNQADNDISSLVFSSLFKFDKDGNIEPDIAESLKMEDNGKKYVIRIKDGVLFHDNTELTSRDIAQTINNIKDKDYKSQLRGAFSRAATEIIDSHTIQFRLEQANTAFTSLLTFGILPEHLWKNIKGAEAQLAVLNIKPIGSGPYKFNSLTKTVNGAIHSITLEANPSFYGKKSNIAKITFVFLGSQAEANEALKNKDIDGLAFIGSEAPRDLRRRADVKLYKPETFNYSALFFNLSRGAAGVPTIRKALSLSLEREKLYEDVVKDTGLPMSGPIPPELLVEPRESPTLNLAEAEKILDEAGWIKGADGTRRKNIKAKTKKDKDREELLEINLVTTDDLRYASAAEIIKQSWERLGVRVNLEILPIGGLREALQGRNYDVLLYGQALAQDLDLYPFWHSSEINSPGLNLSVLVNREVDVLVEKARKEQNFEAKLPYYQELETIFSREIPAIFLWSQSSYYVVSDKVRGIQLGRIINPADRFANIAEWYIKSRRVFK